MKRYLVFSGSAYYPAGGWKDFLQSFDTEGEAQSLAESRAEEEYCDWWQVVDSQTGEVTVEMEY